MSNERSRKREVTDRGDAGDDAVVTKLSPWSMAETLARLSAAVAARGMEVFAVIDHSGQALRDFYATRLNLVERYDRAGFYAYHVAEHHGTPLGMSPSPTVFLSAAIQRTKRIGLGPLVLILPLYNPLRIIDEIAMLDQIPSMNTLARTSLDVPLTWITCLCLLHERFEISD